MVTAGTLLGGELCFAQKTGVIRNESGMVVLSRGGACGCRLTKGAYGLAKVVFRYRASSSRE